MEGRRIIVRGTVQGVGFRPWVYRLAHEHGLGGRVNNDAHGVLIEVFGTPGALDRFVEGLRSSPPPAARINSLDWSPIPLETTGEFVIVESEAGDQPRVSIPPDLATCADCLAELRSPSDRRFGYAFTNCTNCGPRYTIARDVPYDRATTTMSAFEMCPACRREYETPTDRRFHAEPNACPVCGPALQVLGANGALLTGADPLLVAGRALLAGSILAVKGLGGFHLACDATNADAVLRLRERKRREEKPLAVMVADLVAADALAELDDDERQALERAVRPIVLVRRRRHTRLVPAVAPGNPLVGLMLPYTPLHHLLLDAVQVPLVMTSGNLSEEPLAYRNEEAVERLAGIADLFLVHDRDIETPCDDSVVRVVSGAPTVFRRSRGYVPRPVPLARPVAGPTLACGALLKNTFCLARSREAWPGPHVGDLDNLATHRFFEAAIERFERFLRFRPEIIAHDLHPEYHSTTYALSRGAATTIGVQHHHAHVASAMAEHGLEGPVLGLAWDGTGYGTDGSAWGGELLLATYSGFERLATFRPVPLAGGDAAIRQVWRIGLALVADAFGDAAPLADIPLFQHIPDPDLRVVRQLVAQRVNAPLAHGVGRYFDGFGAIGLARRQSHFEGQVAAMWDHVAEEDERGAYPWALDEATSPWVVDLRPAVRAMVGDLRARTRAGILSARFHGALQQAGAAIVERAVSRYGRLPVVLTGGCFQNARLAESLYRALSSRGPVYLHRAIPPGDGGLALGQAVVANAIVREARQGP